MRKARLAGGAPPAENPTQGNDYGPGWKVPALPGASLWPYHVLLSLVYLLAPLSYLLPMLRHRVPDFGQDDLLSGVEIIRRVRAGQETISPLFDPPLALALIVILLCMVFGLLGGFLPRRTRMLARSVMALGALLGALRFWYVVEAYFKHRRDTAAFTDGVPSFVTREAGLWVLLLVCLLLAVLSVWPLIQRDRFH